MNLYEDLKWRGLIKDFSSPDLVDKLNNSTLTFYWGTDPTADSLHLGHYVSLVMAKRLANYGHKPILLVGGATGLIVDPRPSGEREIISKETLDKYFVGIKNQVTRLVPNATLVNNYDWMKNYNFLDFLRDIGKYINVNYILNKDIVSRRLDSGITYAEFSYTLIQGYDFLHLLREKNCLMQVAGSDQWGNITTGIELIRKLEDKEAYGFTMPLILDKTGKKFGKSEGNALWLDKNKTTSYQLYQYLVNTDDSLVIDYLKVFTFLSKEQIEELEEKHKKAPELREAHKALAREIITDIHGEEEYKKALKISESLFTDKINELSAQDILNNMKDVPTFTVSEGENIVDMTTESGICKSKREAREFISCGAISINNKKVDTLEYTISKEEAIDGQVLLIKKGKKNYFVGKFN